MKEEADDEALWDENGPVNPGEADEESRSMSSFLAKRLISQGA
jgi:hypothetical protein